MPANAVSLTANFEAIDDNGILPVSVTVTPDFDTLPAIFEYWGGVLIAHTSWANDRWYTVTLIATVSPHGANQAVTWGSEAADAGYIELSDGQLTIDFWGQTPESFYITATAENGVTGSIWVEMIPHRR